jgi:hypothetical protein
MSDNNPFAWMNSSGTRADSGCTCGQAHTDAARAVNTFRIQDSKGRMHTFDGDLWTPGAAAESLDALERIEARCGQPDQPAGFCRGR